MDYMNQSAFRSLLALLSFIALCACGPTKQAAQIERASTLGTDSVEAPRVAVDLNPGWKFLREDADGAEFPNFDDSAWQSVDLPHTWNNLDGEDGHDDYHRGPAWYRKHLTLDPSVKGKSLFLWFGAAGSNASVYVNGKLAGLPHKGFFAAFCYDVTPLVNPDGDNVIAVRCTNEKDHTIPPISADFTFFGGLYRGARLLALAPVSISPLDDASPGVYAKQVKVTDDHADIEVTTKLRNSIEIDEPEQVTCDLLDADGKLIKSQTAQQSIPAGGTADAVQSISLDHPHLWNGRKDPYLYHVRVSVAQGSNVLDRVTQPLGLRYFSVDPDKGFFLNGQSYPLHGVNRHQDRIDMGWAITEKQHQEDFDLIMEMGCTGIRLAHYQHAQEFYDLCDRGGLVVWAEACMVNQIDRSDAFEDTVKQQLRELVKQSYNHPSICFWSLSNELRIGKEKGQGEHANKEMVDHYVKVIKDLNDESHQLDNTRFTVQATLNDKAEPIDQITDVIGWNKYFGWYSKTNAAWPDALDQYHAENPGRAMAISEYGAGASIYQHEIDPKQPKTTARWHPEEWQGITHEAAYKAMKARPYLWGTFLWNMFDFAADQRAEGDHLGRNDKGLVTYDRKTKKDAFYFYKANWSDEPVIYICDRRFTPRNVAKGPVKVYSNCDSVALKLNGTSIGQGNQDDCVFTWPHITLVRGHNTIEATGTRNGREYNDTISITYDPGVIDVRPVEPATKPTTAPSTMPVAQG
jgi:beta-galactosidase